MRRALRLHSIFDLGFLRSANAKNRECPCQYPLRVKRRGAAIFRGNIHTSTRLRATIDSRLSLHSDTRRFVVHSARLRRERLGNAIQDNAAGSAHRNWQFARVRTLCQTAPTFTSEMSARYRRSWPTHHGTNLRVSASLGIRISEATQRAFQAKLMRQPPHCPRSL